MAPGKTLAEAKWGEKEVFTMGEVSRRGPDALLGVKLGEVFRENGQRKTNPELFIEELGWHVESTPGDRVYEWFNPDLTFYTYKITATDSDKYYFGVSHVKKAHASVRDCLDHPYMGSGGGGKSNKFTNWKKKHQAKLKKEVISLHSSKAEAYSAEKSLVGSLYSSDELCLNSAPGGVSNLIPLASNVELKKCEVHGLVKHRGKYCFKCGGAKAVSVAFCSIHGESKFRGDHCYACTSGAKYSLVHCAIHGMTLHQGRACSRCASEFRIKTKKCAIHGMTKHAGVKCISCINASAFHEAECMIHGAVKFLGSECFTCLTVSSITFKQCRVHGWVKHRGDNCYSCRYEKSNKVKKCTIHGMVLHVGDKCRSCFTYKPRLTGFCSHHGETNFSARGTCLKCSYGGKKDLCLTHGLTSFVGNQCKKCTVTASIAVKTCAIHGETKHQGDSCYKCRAARRAVSKKQD